jgi:hypothetical protein
MMAYLANSTLCITLKHTLRTDFRKKCKFPSNLTQFTAKEPIYDPENAQQTKQETVNEQINVKTETVNTSGTESEKYVFNACLLNKTEILGIAVLATILCYCGIIISYIVI